jgi:hypothetical protein
MVHTIGRILLEQYIQYKNLEFRQVLSPLLRLFMFYIKMAQPQTTGYISHSRLDVSEGWFTLTFALFCNGPHKEQACSLSSSNL